MRVAEIWRFPVKSMGGERIDQVALTAHGVDGDRAWGVVDVSTGLVLTARREPALLFLSASHRVGRRPEVRTETGDVVPDDAALSEVLSRAVRLRPASDGPGTFESPLVVDDVGRESEWVSWESAGSTFHDGASTVSVVSTDTLGDWDARRFRSNIVVEGAGEDDWSGQVSIGSAVLAIRRPIDRCVMVTRAQPGLPNDLSVLRRVMAERRNRLAIGATVARPGVVTVGDRIVP
ncbi:MAG: hypothetical protein RLZZ01_1397 [Actinomycetota bacterium]